MDESFESATTRPAAAPAPRFAGLDAIKEAETRRIAALKLRREERRLAMPCRLTSGYSAHEWMPTTEISMWHTRWRCRVCGAEKTTTGEVERHDDPRSAASAFEGLG